MELPISGQHVQAPPLGQDIHHVVKDRTVGDEFVAQIVNVQDLLVRILWIATSKFRSGKQKTSNCEEQELLCHSTGSSRSNPPPPEDLLKGERVFSEG